MGFAAPISSALNTLTLGALGNREPEPIVLRDAGDGSFSRQDGTAIDEAYSSTKWTGVGLASAGWIGVMGAAEGVSHGFHVSSTLGTFGVRAVEWGAGAALTLGAALVALGGLQSDKVRLVYEDTDGNAKVDSNGIAMTKVINRSEYEAGVTRPG